MYGTMSATIIAIFFKPLIIKTPNYCYRSPLIKSLNSFNVDVKAKFFSEFCSEVKLLQLLNNKSFTHEPLFIIGEGSNILFTKNFNGLILANRIKGIEVVSEDKLSMTIEVGAGENWHNFVHEKAEGLLSNEIDSWMTGVNLNVEGKQTRTIVRYSGTAPEYRERCDQVAASGYNELHLL